MEPLDEIFYVLAIPSFEPNEVTPFQGFAPGLIYVSPLLQHAVQMPADIVELTMDPADRLVRRRSGGGDWAWTPVNIENLERPGRAPSPIRPFMVVFSADRAVARRVSRWRRNLRIRPLHVSEVAGVGAVAPADFTVERLQQHCLTALGQAHDAMRRLDVDAAEAAIRAWRPFEQRPSSLRLHSHGVTQANQMVLLSAGERLPDNEDGVLNVSPHEDYVTAITESAQAVRDLRAQTEDRPVYLISPPRPDVILMAPSMYQGVGGYMANVPLSPVARRAFRAIQRQRGYTFNVRMEMDDIDEVGPIGVMRGVELKLQNFAVGMRAASTLAATIRLPGQVNRISGVVGQLARHLRHYDENLPDVKTARVFKVVQDALRDSIPEPHMAFLEGAQSGVKIIADAPLEWMPVGNLPLGIKFDVSRINATPGNTLIEQLRPRPPTHIRSEAFKRYLVVSMFDDNDGIAHHIRRGLEALPEAGVQGIAGITATADTVEEFIAAVNAYDGPILIIDSHGTHEGDVGGLIIGGQSIDIWSLKDRIKLPPIVILSACDTHPFDRSHATVANGFLHCGAQAVLATVLPIRSVPAAAFLVRLLLRAISFGNAMNGMGRAASWTNVVGGALRMQLASDVVRDLVRRGMVPGDQARALQLQTNVDINTPRSDWLDRLGDRCREAGGFDQAQWDKTFADILAASDAIRYTHVGNPESLLISDERVWARAAAEAGVDLGGEPHVYFQFDRAH